MVTSKEFSPQLIFKQHPWFLTFLLVLVTLLVWGVIAYDETPIQKKYSSLPPGTTPNWIDHLAEPWRHWDTRHYLNIAENWYSTGGPELTWPPVYPIFVGLLGRLLGGAYLPAALLISWISLITACSLLIKTYQDYTDEPTAQRAVKYLLIFPSAFFLFAGYTESLFLVFMLLSWQGAKKGIWSQASIFGLLASLTRFIGFALVISYGWMWLKAPLSQKTRIAAWLLPIPLARLGWYWYTERYYGINPSTAILKFWHLHNDFPWEGVINGIKFLFTSSHFSIQKLYVVEDLLATIIFIMAILWAAKKRWWPETIFMATALLRYLILVFEDTSILTMTARYVLILFPGFLLLAELGKNRWFDWLWSGISFLSMLFFATFFFVG